MFVPRPPVRESARFSGEGLARLEEADRRRRRNTATAWFIIGTVAFLCALVYFGARIYEGARRAEQVALREVTHTAGDLVRHSASFQSVLPTGREVDTGCFYGADSITIIDSDYFIKEIKP